MTTPRFSHPALADDRLRERLHRGAVTAVRYAAAVLDLESADADVTGLAAAETAFLLRCRDVVRVVESLPYALRPKGWNEGTP